MDRHPLGAGSNETFRVRDEHEIARLAVLARMGLADKIASHQWRVRCDFEQVLRAMQRTGDGQRTLAAHGALLSDERLPIEVLDLRRMTSVQGRILVHGQDEETGRNYLMLEGTEGKVHFINNTSTIEEARNHGELRTNSFVRLRRLQSDNRTNLDIKDFGDAERLLTNRALLRDTVRRPIELDETPTEAGWGGWPGRYQAAIGQLTLQTHKEQIGRGEQGRHGSRGR